jgi:hypothetical protein
VNSSNGLQLIRSAVNTLQADISAMNSAINVTIADVLSLGVRLDSLIASLNSYVTTLATTVRNIV